LKVCVRGLGYVELATAAVLATKGFAVLGVDIDCARAGQQIMVFETTTIWSLKGRII